MKLIGTFLLLAVTLIGMTLSIPSNAQYALEGGFYVTDPNPLPVQITSYGIACTSSSCGAFIEQDGGFSVKYTTALVWTGPGEPDYSVFVKANVEVDGSSSTGNGSNSSAHASSPGVTVNGACGNGTSYGPNQQPATDNGQFPQTLTATLYVAGAGTGSPYANAQVNFSFWH